MKVLLKFLSSPKTTAVLFIVFASSIAIATFIEHRQNTEAARNIVYNAKWFEILLILGIANLGSGIFIRKLFVRQKFTVFLFHMAFIVILVGAGITRYFGLEGMMQIKESSSSDSVILNNNTIHKLPFVIELKDFKIDYYPGSSNPMGYESEVVLHDAVAGINIKQRIFMNNILKYKGYRFFQASYFPDQSGTILSVTKDPAGTSVSYVGYLLLAFGIILSLFNKNSRLAFLLKPNHITVLLYVFIILKPDILEAQNSDSLPIIPKEHAEKFGTVLVRDLQGRTMPVNTLANDVFRKISRKSEYKGQTAMQVMLGALIYPEIWQNIPIVYAGKDLADELDFANTRISIYECYAGQGLFVTSVKAFQAQQKMPSKQTKKDKDLIKLDERLNIFYHWMMANMLTVFPFASDSVTRWYTPISIKEKIHTADSVYIESLMPLYVTEVKKSMISDNWDLPDRLIEGIKAYQNIHGKHLPSKRKVNLEIFYYKFNFFTIAARLFLFAGITMLLFQLVLFYKGKGKFIVPVFILKGIFVCTFLIHSAGMIIRWYISGHAPWSNAFETMLLIAWSSSLAGILFLSRNRTIPALSAILASVFILVANMSWMDPQITNLVPVLRSKWLIIHVAVITSSYGFLGIGALMALSNIILMGLASKSNSNTITGQVSAMTCITEATLIIGLYLITIGTFLGSVWANVSWGRYWGWDPKETWALITILVYAFILHIRLVPKLHNEFLFNVLALFGFGSVLMTYFGVNFYLSGKHSYASGDPIQTPTGLIITVILLLVVTSLAYLNQKRLKKTSD